MNLILFEREEIDADGRVSVEDARAAHLLRVLTVTPGSAVRIGLVNGPIGRGMVETVRDGVVGLACSFEPTAPARSPIDLLLALPRPKVMRRLWAQIAAIGVGQIVLTNAERVERDYFDTHILAPESYRPLLIEGLQQARDTQLPVVSVHRRFKVLVEDELDRLFPDGQRLMADPSAEGTIGEEVGERGRVLVAVGPEGGWNEFERQLLTSHGFRAVGMGARTLRTDTACVALLALVSSAVRSRVGRGY